MCGSKKKKEAIHNNNKTTGSLGQFKKQRNQEKDEEILNKNAQIKL